MGANNVQLLAQRVSKCVEQGTYSYEQPVTRRGAGTAAAAARRRQRCGGGGGGGNFSTSW